jgi:hypothetical protein
MGHEMRGICAWRRVSKANSFTNKANVLPFQIVMVEAVGVEPKSASKTKGLFDSKRDRVQEIQRNTDHQHKLAQNRLLGTRRNER